MNDEPTAGPLPTSWPELSDPSLLDRIIDIIAEDGNVERDAITPEATLETLGLESMDVVMVLMGVEEKLDVYVPMDTDLAAARNLSEFIGSITKAMESNLPVRTAGQE